MSEPPWCVVANVRAEAFGNATSPGTRHFRAGALLWIASRHWHERIVVLGRHRGSLRWVELVEEYVRLTNFRVKQAFHPWVASRLTRWPTLTREECVANAAFLNEQFPPLADLQGDIARHRHALALLENDARGRALYAQAMFAIATWKTHLERTPPPEVQVLADYLEEHGAVIPLDELARTLDRRRAP